MAAPKTMHGARAQFRIYDPNTNSSKVVGIFSSLSFALTYDAQPVYILGRFSPAEIAITGQEPVTVTATGWRVIDHGPHADGKIPNLKDLLTLDSIQLDVFDRQTQKRVAIIRDVKPTGYSTTISNRQLEEITCTFVGLLVDDESTTNVESANASTLP